MRCPRCGDDGVDPGATCRSCGAVAVAVEADALDSLLAMPAEPLPDDAELSDLADDAGGRLGAAGWAAPPPLPPVTADPPGPPPVAPHAALDARPDLPGDPDPPGAEPAEVEAEAEPVGPPLPRRRPLSATAPQWGPRPHPPAVLAPPPPSPLDAPAAPRTRPPSGTGLPPGFSIERAAQATRATEATPPAAAAAAPPSAAPAPAVPERPSHPRVRRWFGRGTEPPPESAATPTAGPPAGATGTAGAAGPLVEGAPDGLLDGVTLEVDRGEGVVDPAGVEAAAARLSAGARRAALAPLAVVATVLEPGERAEAVVQGEYQHRPGVVVLTDRRVVVANDRRWAPDVRSLPLGPDLVVHGWQDDRRATLVLVPDGTGVVVQGIVDRPLARDLARRIRACCGQPDPDEPGS